MDPERLLHVPAIQLKAVQKLVCASLFRSRNSVMPFKTFM